MHEITTAIEIDAAAEKVWSTLVDVASHSQWNPFIRSIKGNIKNGEKLDVHIQPPGGRGMTFHPTILAAIPNQELRWLGRFLLPGIFDGEHYFQIIPLAPGRVRLVHGEKFSGLLVGLMKASLDKGTRAGFLAMNQALKSRVENTVPIQT
jgi:hypothetical protein